MVNKLDRDSVRDMKSYILRRITTEGEPVGGSNLAEELGISRTAIWKHIQTLQSAGYPITTGHNGYQLEPEEEAKRISRWSVEGETERLHWHSRLDSTMIEARRLAEEGALHRTIVGADRQMIGRGRLSRSWDSSEGGLYFSLILRPKAPLESAHRYTFLCSLAAAQLIEAALPSSQAGAHRYKAGVKWPNDVLVSGKKIAGILTELRGEPGRIDYLCIGIGINVANPLPEALSGQAVNLKELTEDLKITMPGRAELLRRFIRIFDELFPTALSRELLEMWRERSDTLGRQVTVDTGSKKIEGKARDVDESGGLIIETESGTQTIHAGDIIHARHR